MALDPAEAAERYRAGESACTIGADHGLTKSGTEDKIRKGGITGGLAWCPVHRKHEAL